MPNTIRFSIIQVKHLYCTSKTNVEIGILNDVSTCTVLEYKTLLQSAKYYIRCACTLHFYENDFSNENVCSQTYECGYTTKTQSGMDICYQIFPTVRTQISLRAKVQETCNYNKKTYVLCAVSAGDRQLKHLIE